MPPIKTMKCINRTIYDLELADDLFEFSITDLLCTFDL